MLRWLNYKDATGKKGADLLEGVIEFVDEKEKADYGISWHGDNVYKVQQKKCIIFKNEPPIYNAFFGWQLCDPKYLKKYAKIMSSCKFNTYDYYYNIPRYEFELVNEFFDKPKDKLICMILRNKKNSQRALKMVPIFRIYNRYSLLPFRKESDYALSEYFGETMYQSYGGPWTERCYQGEIPGGGKWEVFSQYKFTFCPENSRFNGYVTEKPIQPMCCGSIPIYYGAPDVEQYLPKGTFINFAEFKNIDEVCDYIYHMNENEYRQYRENIRRFVTTDESRRFSSVAFAETFLGVLNEVVR